MTNISSAASLIAQPSAGSQTSGGNAGSTDGDVVKASFNDILSQVQSIVTGKPRTGFNNGGAANSIAAQTNALKAQTKAAIDGAVSQTKSLLSLTPKSGFHP